MSQIYCELCGDKKEIALPCNCEQKSGLPFTVEEILGSESAAVMRLVNRLYVLGHHVRHNEKLCEALCECMDILTARVKKGEEEAMEFLTHFMHEVTIQELQQLNSQGISWPAGVLYAIIGCGIETARHQKAKLVSRACEVQAEGCRYIDLEFLIVEGSKVIGKIALTRDIDGTCDWRPTTWLKSHECLSAVV